MGKINNRRKSKEASTEVKTTDIKRKIIYDIPASSEYGVIIQGKATKNISSLQYVKFKFCGKDGVPMVFCTIFAKYK